MAFDQNKPLTNGTLSSADIRNNFQHLKSAIAKEHNWSDSDPNASSHNLDAIKLDIAASTQGGISTGGSVRGGATVLNQVAGMSGGTYTLKKIIQELVNRSHEHSTSSLVCNCNDCDCNCGDDSH